MGSSSPEAQLLIIHRKGLTAINQSNPNHFLHLHILSLQRRRCSCLYRVPHLLQRNSQPRTGGGVFLEWKTCMYASPTRQAGAERSAAVRLLHCRGRRFQMEERCRMFIFGRSVFLDNSPLLAFQDYQATSVENKQGGGGGGVQNFSYRHKNTGWEHAGCDGTPKCVAVPGAAACLCVAWCAWLFQPAQRQEVCRLSKENTRLLIKNFNAFTTPPSFLSLSWFFASRKGRVCELCQCWWAERNRSTRFQMHLCFTWS